MKATLLALILILIVAAAGTVMAEDWTTTEAGSVVCSKLKPVGICWIATAGANTSAISLRSCSSWTVMVYGTGVSVMPQSCDDSSCTKAEDLLPTALTGDSPNTYMTSAAPMEFIRLVTSDSITASIKCGR